jgi:23S rRNA pseudouridine2605 synthase
MAQERLQKVLASAGIASRRECEGIILEGRVTVNGHRVHSLPVLVEPGVDQIAVDGRPLRPRRKVYFLLNKPKGVHCTNYDPAGRTRAVDLMAGVNERVFPVGRLDAESIGLLLMTNDGELAQQLTHPRHGVPKTYRAHINGMITEEDLAQMHKGIWIAEGKARVSDASIIHAARDQSVVEITLCEGRNREVRRILARLGHNVRKLIRIRIGPLSLRGLAPGHFRPLTPAELNALRSYKPSKHRKPAPGRKHRATPDRPVRTGSAGDRPGRRPRKEASEPGSAKSDGLILRRRPAGRPQRPRGRGPRRRAD